MASATLYSFNTGLDVTAHVERLPSGQYVGFIQYVAPGEVGEVHSRLESFRAGVFDEPHKAHAAASRLLKTFMESVLPPCRIAA